MILKSAVKLLGSLFNLILTLILVVLFIVFFFWIPMDLTTKSTWIYSSSMQTLAALIALLPISYGYYISNIDDEIKKRMDSYIIDRIKQDVYYDMMFVILYFIFVIILNLVSFFINYSDNFVLVIALLTIEGIGLMALYIYRLFNPNKVKEILKEFDTSDEINKNQKQISLDVFITEYLKLETQVKDFISNENDNELVDKLPLYDIIDNFSKDFNEIQENYDLFKEIIFHRNNLIHNYNDTVVDFNKYQKMIELQEMFEKWNTMFVQKRIFGNVVKIRNTIETVLKEYKNDYQNRELSQGELPENFKDDIVSLLSSYFVSDYYYSNNYDEAKDIDFEIVQNNYSERRILGIDIKSISKKNYTQISTSFFKRMSKRFMYLVLINFDPDSKLFLIQYNTKENELKTFSV